MYNSISHHFSIGINNNVSLLIYLSQNGNKSTKLFSASYILCHRVRQYVIDSLYFSLSNNIYNNGVQRWTLRLFDILCRFFIFQFVSNFQFKSVIKSLNAYKYYFNIHLLIRISSIYLHLSLYFCLFLQYLH